MYQMLDLFYLILNPIRYNYVKFLRRITLTLRKLCNLSEVTQLGYNIVFHNASKKSMPADKRDNDLTGMEINFFLALMKI